MTGELQRKDTKRLEVEREIKILQAAAANDISPEVPKKVYTKNISNGGMCLISDGRIKEGTIIEADVLLRTDGLEKFRAYMMAVWSRAFDGEGCFETGAQFLAMKEADSARLEKYIQNHIN